MASTRIVETRTGSFAGGLWPGDPATRIRPFTPADDAFCRALFHEERAGQFAPLGLSNAVLAAMLDQQFDTQRMAYASRFPGAESFIIAHAGADVGRLIVTVEPTAPPSPVGHTIHLIDITIAAAARGRGIGSDIVESLVRAGHAAGASRMTLMVLQSNHAARRLYERLGFVARTDSVHMLMIRDLP